MFRYAIMIVTCALSLVTLSAKTLVLNVENLRSHKGNLMLYLWSSPDRYLNKHTADYRVIYDLEKPGNTPVNGLIRLQVNELGAQPYAIMVYHDENRSYNFERNFIGLPMEGFAFGNNATPKFGAPKFQEAAVDLSGHDAEQRISIVYK